jgi:hypothetical protein
MDTHNLPRWIFNEHKNVYNTMEMQKEFVIVCLNKIVCNKLEI